MSAATNAVAVPEPPILKVAPLLFVLMWSTGFIGAKYGVPVAGPFSLLFLRFILVLPILGLVAFAMGQSWPGARAAFHAMVAGALIHGCYLGGIFHAIGQGLPAGVSGLVVGLQPVLTALFAFALIGERIGRGHIVGLALGIAGVAAILWPKLDAVDGFSPTTAAVALGAVVAIALGTVYAKRTGGGADLVTGTALQFVGATIVLAPVAALEGFNYVPSLQLVAVVGWLVLVLSIGAVLLLLLMVRHGAVSRVATLFYLVPPTTAGMAWLLFGETLELIQLIGTAAVVAAVFVAGRENGASR
jgi:drug/metabolite transporter (DMT)-like permease